MITNKNVIIISSIDWSTHWQMHHQLTAFLLESGNRVLFIENTGVRGARVSDIKRIRERVTNWIKSTKGFRQVKSSLVTFSPLFLPFPNSKLAQLFNRTLISRSIRNWLKAAKFSEPILFTFLPTPLSLALIEDIDPSLLIYYCVDNMSASSQATHYLKPYEEKLFRMADLVFVTSKSIFDRAVEFNQKVYSFPAGVDFEKFEKVRNDKNMAIPEDIQIVKKPIIGYIGALSGVLDQDLLCHLASENPEATILLVGPVHTDIKKLEKFKNIVLVGGKPHDEIPKYVKQFDVSLIPYLITDFTDSVYSCKLNEYLSMGIPVVTTNLKEINLFKVRHGDVVSIAKNEIQFNAAVQLELNGDSDIKRLQRIEIAKINGWNSRFSDMNIILEKAILDMQMEKKEWQERFLGFYKKGQQTLIRIFLSFAVVYTVLFYTPFVWFMAQPLTVFSLPRQADAIVVFGGYGEIGWVNLGFQRRVKEALTLYNQGYAPVILISSGERYDFSEIDLMKAILKESGVPSENIIPDFGAGSTLDSVLHTSKILKERNFTTILLVSSKYHMRRAILTWNKNSPDIMVIPAQIETSNSIIWGASMDQIKVIVYEYIALSHNWFIGRI